MIRIIIEIPDQEDAKEENYTEVTRYYQDVIKTTDFNYRFRSELVKDTYRVG